MLNEILTRQPVNKTAAIVTGEGHRDFYEEPEEVKKLKDERRDVVDAYKQVTDELSRIPKNHPKRERLKRRQLILSSHIKGLNKKLAMQKIPPLGMYIIAEAKKVLTKHQWEKILTNAYRRQFEEASQ